MAQFTIRISDAMHARIKAAAANDERSLNREVAWLLNAGLDVRDTRPRAGGQVRHKDGDLTNNDLSNLEVVYPETTEKGEG